MFSTLPAPAGADGQTLTSPSPEGAAIPAVRRSLAKIHSTGSSVPTWKAIRTAYGSSPE